MLGRAYLKKIKALKQNDVSLVFLQQRSTENIKLNVLVMRSLESVKPVLFHQAFLWPGDILSGIARKCAVAEIAVNRSKPRSITMKIRESLVWYIQIDQKYVY